MESRFDLDYVGHFQTFDPDCSPHRRLRAASLHRHLILLLHRIDQLQWAVEKFLFRYGFQIRFALVQHALSHRVGIE